MWVRTPSRPLEYLCNKGSKQGGCTSSPLERAQWELTQQDGEKNEDGRVTKKGRTRSGIQDIFSSFCCTVTVLLRKVPFITRESAAAILRQMFSTSQLSGTAPLSKYVLFVFSFFSIDRRNDSEKKKFRKKKRVKARWINSFTSPVMWPWPYASTGLPFCLGYVISRMRTVISPWQYISHG